MESSAYTRALGERFDELHPRLRSWFAPRRAVTGSGRFTEVGSRLRWLRPLWLVLARFGMLCPEYGRDVPFEVLVTPLSATRLSTRRTVRFDEGPRIISDTSRSARDRLVDAHANGRLLVEMFPAVDDGDLVASSGRARLVLAGLRIPVPSPRVRLRHHWDDTAGQHTIDVAVTVPLLGEVFGYRGHFTADTDAPTTAVETTPETPR